MMVILIWKSAHNKLPALASLHDNPGVLDIDRSDHLVFFYFNFEAVLFLLVFFEFHELCLVLAYFLLLLLLYFLDGLLVAIHPSLGVTKEVGKVSPRAIRDAGSICFSIHNHNFTFLFLSLIYLHMPIEAPHRNLVGVRFHPNLIKGVDY